MDTHTPTSTPQLCGTEFDFLPVSTEVKTTQSNTSIRYSATRDFTLLLPHKSKREYKVGDWVNISDISDAGAYWLDGYRCHLIDGYWVGEEFTKSNYFPAEFVQKRLFCIVREYKTTEWEIVAR